MIGYIKGTFEEVLVDGIYLESNGIGYYIHTSGKVLSDLSLSQVHQQMKFYTYLHVREDELSLFGFPTSEELDTFKLLISVNGIGPKAALAILSVLTVNELAMAVMTDDAKVITRANGIGTKGANRIIMELKGKLTLDDVFAEEETVTGKGSVMASGESDSVQDTVLALVSLGYSEPEALAAVKQIPGAKTMESEELLKAALKKMF